MNEYPRLKQMGVENPGHIVRYSISSLASVDYLTIGYIRPQGSLLPVSRTYAFERVQKRVKAADGSGKEYDVLETSQPLIEAKAELKAICEARKTTEGKVAALTEELQLLEEQFSHHAATIKSMIKEIEDQ